MSLSNDELSKCIAGVLFGWSDFWRDPESGKFYGHMPNPHIEDDRMPVADYATDPTCASAVIERMRELWHANNEDEPHFWQFVDCHPVGWRVDVMWAHHDGDVLSYSVSDETLERAVCIAALMYMELIAEPPVRASDLVPSNQAA